MTLRRMALISVVAGLLIGGWASVVSLDLFMLAPAMFCLFMFWSMRRLRAENPGHVFLAPTIALIQVAIVVLVAQAMPLKFIDHETVQLDSPCATVGEVVVRAKSRLDTLPSSFAETRVCFGSSTPTLREVIRECERQANVTVRVSYCGRGTILLGATPMRRPLFLPRAAF